MPNPIYTFLIRQPAFPNVRQLGLYLRSEQVRSAYGGVKPQVLEASRHNEHSILNILHCGEPYCDLVIKRANTPVADAEPALDCTEGQPKFKTVVGNC